MHCMIREVGKVEEFLIRGDMLAVLFHNRTMQVECRRHIPKL